MNIEINDDVFKEFEYMAELLDDGRTAKDIIDYTLASVADGSRRPGSWERQMLESMGLVAETDKHHVYRNNYGQP